MYYAIMPTNNDIEHKAHKYIERRMGRNGKWIYYYTKKPSLKGRAGVYAKEKLQKQQLNSAVKLDKMPNNSREQAEAKQTQRNIEYKKIEKAQTEYSKTALGKLEKFANSGMRYLERLGLISTRTKITSPNTKIPTYTTTSLPARTISSPTISTKTTKKKTKLRDRR